jgi:adenylate kinase family enzyme
MGHPYARNFLNFEIAENFLKNVLNQNPKKFEDVITKIVKAEKLLAQTADASTWGSPSDRIQKYRDDEKRWELRTKIIEELFTLPRLNDDDEIDLEKGGALPQSGVKKENKAFLIIGLPASGKSHITNTISENYGAIIIDSDLAKRKLPEYRLLENGATLVHDESDFIVNGFGATNPENVMSLYERALAENYSMVIPKVGQNLSKLVVFVEALTQKGYEINLILTSLRREDATLRAIDRLDKSGRYVPLGLIFDAYGNDPILNYYLLRAKYSHLFASFTAITTAQKPGKCIDTTGNNPCGNYVVDTTLNF